MASTLYDKDGNIILTTSSDTIGRDNLFYKGTDGIVHPRESISQDNWQFDGSNLLTVPDGDYVLDNGSVFSKHDTSVNLTYYDNDGTRHSVWDNTQFRQIIPSQATNVQLVLGDNYSYLAYYLESDGRWHTGSNNQLIAWSDSSIKGTGSYQPTYSGEDWNRFWNGYGEQPDTQDWSVPSGTTNTQEVDFPTLPAEDAVTAGFLNLYSLTKTEARTLVGSLLTNNVWDIIKNWWEHPLDSILFCRQYPFNIDSANLGTHETIRVGGYDLQGATGTKVVRQFMRVDLGTIDVREIFGNFVDYNPYTSASIMLYGMGEKDININDIMDSKIQLVYYIDLISGGCVAQLKVKKNKPTPQLNSVLYQWTGTLGQELPLNQTNAQGVLNAVKGLAGAAAAYVTGGATLAASSGAEVGIGTAGAAMANFGEKVGYSLMTSSGTQLLGSASGFLTGGGRSVSRTGSFGGALSMLTPKQTYLVLNAPVQENKDRQSTVGGPTNKKHKVSDCQGIASFITKEVNISKATSVENNLIKTILSNGILINA